MPPFVVTIPAGATDSTSDDPSIHGTTSSSSAPLYSPSGVSSGRPNSLSSVK